MDQLYVKVSYKSENYTKNFYFKCPDLFPKLKSEIALNLNSVNLSEGFKLYWIGK